VIAYKKKDGYEDAQVKIINSDMRGYIYRTKNGKIHGSKDVIKVKEKDISNLYQQGFMKKIR
jgi:hypothetical protein